MEPADSLQRRWWLVLGLRISLLAAPVAAFSVRHVAHADQPVPRDPQGFPALSRTEIGPDLRSCSAEADSRGEFGDITVEIVDRTLRQALPSRQIGRETYHCVCSAIERLLDDERRAPKGRVDPKRQVSEVTIGRPRPLLPPLPVFLQAWAQ